MPTQLGWRDSLAAAFTNDTISYVLPANMEVDAAPSSIVIDGYATLRMERTRILNDQTQVHMVDQAIRQPLHVAPRRGAEPNRHPPAPLVNAEAHPAVEQRETKGLWACIIGAALCGGLVSAGIFAAMPPVASVLCIVFGVFNMFVCGVGAEQIVNPPMRQQHVGAAPE